MDKKIANKMLNNYTVYCHINKYNNNYILALLDKVCKLGEKMDMDTLLKLTFIKRYKNIAEMDLNIS